MSSDCGETLENSLHESLMLIHDWFNSNKLSLNLKKTFSTIFGTRPRLQKCTNVSITVANVEITCKPIAKYLGVQLDKTLSFHEHVEYLKSKTLGKLKLLGKIRPIMDQTTAMSLYTSLIVLIYDYCDVVYNCIHQKDSRTLQRLQNMGLKTILKMGKLASTELIRLAPGVLPLELRRDMHTANEMAKVPLGIAPEPIPNMFPLVLSDGPQTRRQAHGVFMNFPNTNWR